MHRLFLLVFLISSPLLAAFRTIELKNGAQLSGEVLAMRPDAVIVDLGFTVVTIPGGFIAGVRGAPPNAENAGPAPKPEAVAAESGADLFSAASPGAPARSVNENVARVGGAVVLVRTPVGLGSGFFINPAGYIITNHHVVAGEHVITVTTFNRTDQELERVEYKKVRIVALSPADDLALLKIEDGGDTQFPSLSLGDSGALQAGQGVFAIGSPLGLDRTVSQGIVSSRNRLMAGRLYIQTTTQINPGNSGGPLFDFRGAVIGINNMKAMQAGIEGLNFAIPVNVLKDFLRNRDAYAFDPRNPNTGFRYLSPPSPVSAAATDDAADAAQK